MHSSMTKLKKPKKMNPFQPTSGAAPPYLAGRKKDLNVFQDCLDCMADPKHDARDPMVLFGPRGNGKTALLLHMAAMGHEQRLRVVWPSKEQLATPTDLANHLTAMTGDGQSLKTKETRKTSGQGGWRTWRLRRSKQAERELLQPVLENALVQMADEKPLLLLIDEAHTLPTHTGDVLLNAEQKARITGSSIQMVLAGTPNLRDALHAMDATFWGRLSKRRRPLGLLNRKDSLDAIAIPMRTAIDEKAADLIMQETSGYPYFLQDMGQALWDSGHPTQTPIDVEAVRKALPAFTQSKSGYYADRLNDLQRDDLLLAACAVTEATKPPHRFAALMDDDIEAACERASAHSQKTAPELFDGLKRSGFLWEDEQSVGQTDPCAVPPWSCGIPTLSQAVVHRVRTRRAKLHQSLLPPKAAQARKPTDQPADATADAQAGQDADGIKKP